MSNESSGANYSGWAAFAGVIMVIVGSLDALWGLGAILNDDVVIVGGQGAIIADITMWGWVHLLLGSAIALTGFGLLTGNSAARWLAIVLRLRERDLADRLVPGSAALGLPDDRPRHGDHLPAHRTLGSPGRLGLS